MPRWLHLLLQALLMIAQVLPHVWHFLEDNGAKTAWAGLVSGLQVWLANIAHGSNPDGTPATVAYQPPK
jgi:hypothetical protein